jgi:hypothetical protein
VPTFYDELGVSAPQLGEDQDDSYSDGDTDRLEASRVRSLAWAKLQARLQSHYGTDKPLPWQQQQRACPEGAGRGGEDDGSCERAALAVWVEKELLDLKTGAAGEKKRGGGDGSARVPSSFLVYEVLADENRRRVYDRYFMPSLASRSVDSAAFLREVCLWDR